VPATASAIPASVAVSSSTMTWLKSRNGSPVGHQRHAARPPDEGSGHVGADQRERLDHVLVFDAGELQPVHRPTVAPRPTSRSRVEPIQR